MSDYAIRRDLVARCLEMNATGLNQGTSGNLSARHDGGMLITPSGIPYDQLRAVDIVRVEMDGRYRHPLAPSSEWRIHRDILASSPAVNAVVHAHPTYCTALAMRGMEIPAAHYMVAISGGHSIRCAPYATYGTQALSDAAVRALAGRTACLLANHGLIATGPSLAKAMWLAVEVETLARQYVVALLLGGANILADDEIERVVERFKEYGMKAAPAAADRRQSRRRGAPSRPLRWRRRRPPATR
ncbi:MAG: class II aldolase/adducin family protein [Rhodospirillales bacterium]|nr:class II aldolase/adducin family protein [Rhodospirillales bacterium]